MGPEAERVHKRARVERLHDERLMDTRDVGTASWRSTVKQKTSPLLKLPTTSTAAAGSPLRPSLCDMKIPTLYRIHRNAIAYSSELSKPSITGSLCARDQHQPYQSRAYDVWSFGCIMLEAIIWLKGVKRFEDERKVRKRNRTDRAVSMPFSATPLETNSPLPQNPPEEIDETSLSDPVNFNPSGFVNGGEVSAAVPEFEVEDVIQWMRSTDKFDIDDLCSALRAKARRSESGVVVEKMGFDAALHMGASLSDNEHTDKSSLFENGSGKNLCSICGKLVGNNVNTSEQTDQSRLFEESASKTLCTCSRHISPRTLYEMMGGGEIEQEHKRSLRMNDELKPKAPKPKSPGNVEQQCGVLLPNGIQCARSLTCKSHSMGEKRNVPGRTMPYDILLANYQRKNQAKQQRAAMDATETSLVKREPSLVILGSKEKMYINYTISEDRTNDKQNQASRLCALDHRKGQWPRNESRKEVSVPMRLQSQSPYGLIQSSQKLGRLAST